MNLKEQQRGARADLPDILAYVFWAATVGCVLLAALVTPWMLIGSIIGFGYSVRIAYIMGEIAGIAWRPFQ